jgi:hypothetical protein
LGWRAEDSLSGRVLSPSPWPKLFELGFDLPELCSQVVEFLHDRVLSGGQPVSLRADTKPLVIAAVTTESSDSPPSMRNPAMILPAVWLGTMSP